MLFDSHVHWAFLNDKALSDLVIWYKANGVLLVIQGGYDSDDWQRQLQLKDPTMGVKSVPCFGLHPWALKTLGSSQIQIQLKYLCAMLETHPCFVGEIGLDKNVANSDKDNVVQEDVLRRQLRIAQRFKRPIVLHVVRRHHRVLQFLNETDQRFSGLVHGFYGSIEVAQEYIKKGLKISIGPQLLRSGNNKLESVVKALNLNQMVFESDFPGDKKISSKHQFPDILEVYQRVCQIKGVSLNDIKESSEENLTSLLESISF